jgi:RNA polymerase sigma factor (sigma-70 family)
MNNQLYKQIGKVKNSEDLVLGNLRLVVHFAKKYQGMGLSLDDLIHEGTVGLCLARDKHDVNKGKFPTYASFWIKAIIRQALNNKSRLIRVPAHKTHLTEESPKICQLDTSYQGSYVSQIEIKHDNDYNDLKIQLLISRLKPNHQEIIKMKFGIGYGTEMKTSDIAKELGLTVQAINGSIRNSLKTMYNA